MKFLIPRLRLTASGQAMCSPLAPRRRNAFTLIEILIVLAIIGILAAILLPVFGSAREAAGTATCSSNLKQIYLGTKLYMQDSNDTYPYLGYVRTDCGWANLIYPYIKSAAVFECPNAEQGEFKTGCPPDTPPTETSQAITWDGSYNYNLLRVGKRQVIREVSVGRPSDVALFVDGSGSYITPYGNERCSDPTGTFDNGYDCFIHAETYRVERHRDGFNFCFADGHIKWISSNDINKRSLWLNSRDAEYLSSPPFVPGP